MKNKIKTILFSSIILSVLLALFFLPVSAETVSVGSVMVAPGGTATVPINVNGITTDLAAASVVLAFDPAVVTVSSVAAGALGVPTVNINNAAGTVTITVFTTSAATTAPVTIANIVFHGVSTASAGSTSALTLTINALSDANGINRKPGASGITNGVVTIGPSTGTVIVIQDAIGNSNMTGSHNAVIPVSIVAKNVQNLGAATLILTYDPSIVTVKSVSSGILGIPIANIDNIAGTAQISSFSIIGSSGNVTIANLQLNVLGSTGETSPLSLSVSALSSSGGSFIPYTINNGQLTIIQYLRGDMNCDNVVNIIDALLIAKYTVGLIPAPYTC